MQVGSSTKKGEIVGQEEARPREVGSELVRMNPQGDSEREDKRALAAAKSPLLLCLSGTLFKTTLFWGQPCVCKVVTVSPGAEKGQHTDTVFTRKEEPREGPATLAFVLITEWPSLPRVSSPVHSPQSSGKAPASPCSPPPWRLDGTKASYFVFPEAGSRPHLRTESQPALGVSSAQLGVPMSRFKSLWNKQRGGSFLAATDSPLLSPS